MKYSIVGIEVETVNVNYNELRSQMPNDLKKYIEIKQNFNYIYNFKIKKYF